MKTKEIMRNLRTKEVAALKKELQDEEAEIRKIMIGDGSFKDTTSKLKHKKTVARILTVLREKEK